MFQGPENLVLLRAALASDAPFLEQDGNPFQQAKTG